MAKKIRFKGKNNDTIVYSSGMSDNDVIEILERRIKKRQVELDKRKWIYVEYCSLMKLQKIDERWLKNFHNGFSIEDD